MDRPLARLLLDRFRWADLALRSRLTALGRPEMTPAQSLVFASIDPEGTRSTELARRIGVTRQAVHQTIGELVDIGLLELIADPSDGRAKLVVVTHEGERTIAAARSAFAEIESGLRARIGVQHITAMRSALEADWGSPELAPPDEKSPRADRK
ncbi:MAG: winged helix DNA-binding protein [Acidimicrobiia bacterium]|nr:MAG: winged helix DNA-binding protein [Acidimicrobiia bacterium]